jgi:hypothetical protein
MAEDALVSARRVVAELKAILILVLVAAGVAYAAGFSELDNKRVTLKQDDIGLDAALQEISEQVGFKVTFSGRLISTTSDVDIEDSLLSDAVETLLEIFGVNSHVLLSRYDGDRLERIEIIGMSGPSQDNATPSAARLIPPAPLGEVGELSDSQRRRLTDAAETYGPSMFEEKGPLTEHQGKRLRRIEQDRQLTTLEFSSELSPEQSARLEESNFWVEREQQYDSPLNNSQINRLESSGANNASPGDGQTGPLSESQMRALEAGD